MTPSYGNAAPEAQDGEVIEVEQATYYDSALDTAEVVHSADTANYPPDANEDAVSTPIDAAIGISVLANDSDPEAAAISSVPFTQPTGGGTVTQTGPTTLT